LRISWLKTTRLRVALSLPEALAVSDRLPDMVADTPLASSSPSTRTVVTWLRILMLFSSHLLKLAHHAPGAGRAFTFDRIGTYRYDCSFHPQSMKGTVIVSGTYDSECEVPNQLSWRRCNPPT
jgi:hypothetical protein